MAIPIDLTNKKFGELTVVSLVPEEERKNSYKRREWLCKCSCGNQVIVEQRNLTGTKYQQASCGCLRVKFAFVATTKSEWINIDYVKSFDDFEKFAFLHKQMVKQLKLFLEEKEYKEFIDYFYTQEQFNAVYAFWKKSEKEDTFYDWYKPSIDHIVPKSKGGTNELSNLQFLTVFENLAKRDMTMEEWNNFKTRTKSSSDLYIENILDK